MNNIEKLAKQCWSHYIDGTLIDGHLHFDYKKFAELLDKEFEAKYFSAGYIQGRSDGVLETARECIDIAQEYDAPKMSGPGMIIASRIETHFGVEDGKKETSQKV